MKYTKTPPSPYGVVPGCHGVVYWSPYEWEIEYDSPIALAHELGHAIEARVTGRTSEYGAWKLAYSFLKPQFWNLSVAQRLYHTYVAHGEHQDEWIIDRNAGQCFLMGTSSCAPEILDFPIYEKEEKR